MLGGAGSQAERLVVRSPSEKGMHSPLCLGSEALSFPGDAAAAAYSVRMELEGALQAGGCGRKGVPILHHKGVSFTKRRPCPHSAEVEAVGSACSSSLSCSLSGVNGVLREGLSAKHPPHPR